MLGKRKRDQNHIVKMSAKKWKTEINESDDEFETKLLNGELVQKDLASQKGVDDDDIEFRKRREAEELR